MLGLTGLTAYFGLLDVGRLRQGESVLVSGAAGGVGTAVGQIAKIKDAIVVGVAGGPEKCRMLVEELGFDGAIDYKGGDLHDALREETPDRVDVFFDNVGGVVLDEGLTRLQHGARVVLCGAVSHYNAREPVGGPGNYLALLVSRASMTGFVVSDFAIRYQERSPSSPAGSTRGACAASRTPWRAISRSSRACSLASSAAKTPASSLSS